MEILCILWTALGSAGPGQTFLLREPLDQVPGSAQVENVSGLEVVAGRLPGQKALLIREASLAWDVKAAAGDALVEVWVKPQAWDGSSPEPVVLARFQAGPAEYVLQKPAGAAQLDLTSPGQGRQTYPIYDWVAQPWMDRSGRDRWHYVNVAFGEGGMRLTVDGFPAQTGGGGAAAGPLSRVVLLGKPGTAYSWLHVIQGVRLAPADLRNRYRSLYRGRPELRQNTVTIPWLAHPPTIDGRVQAGEWDGAASLVGFASLNVRPGALRAEPITAWMGYDERYIYLLIRTPYRGPLNAKHWKRYDMPLWGEESYEMFFHPPYTGTPDFCQLVGNPFGDQADLKMLHLEWNGRWDWKTRVGPDEWIAECRVDFAGIGAPPAGASAVWTGNLVNTEADAGWCWTQRYNDTGSFGVWRFEKAAPVIRPGTFELSGEAIGVPVHLIGRGAARRLTVGLEVYGEKDVLPAAQDVRAILLGPGERQTLELKVGLRGLSQGLVALYVREPEAELFFHSAGFPAAEPRGRTGQRVRRAASGPAAATQPAESPEAEAAYNRTWTAAELGQTLLDSRAWLGNKLGVSEEVPRPWTPMAVEGQTVECWGRRYVYRDSLLPVQIVSAGQSLLAGPARVVLESAGRTLAFEHAAVQIARVHEGLVRVESVSEAGPFRLAMTAAYEFDGMARVEMTLESPEGAERVDALALEFPLRPERSFLYHLVCSASGHAPLSDSGAVPAAGLTLDRFREVVWLGDQQRGWSWFAESLEGWSIQDEKAIQVVEPGRDGVRRFRVKLADRPWRLDRPYRLVFGFQATPVKPRPSDFRQRGDHTACHWQWFWGDGSYYPFQSLADQARAQVVSQRAAGREVMPCSSLLFYGTVRFHRAPLGEIPHPGMIHPEMLLWQDLWLHTTIPIRLPEIPARHTAPGLWYGKAMQPQGITTLCPASPHQDHYLWKLHRLIQDTDLGAIYLDQPISGCSNAHHGCGYVNYAGRWTPRLPIFAMRRMIQRIHRLFYDRHGRTLIRWHSSNQLVPPLLSFIDVFWDGENYGSGPGKVFEFYSRQLSAERMQAQHTGIPFGFAPDLLPEFEERYAPTPASSRDLAGWCFVHDSGVWPVHTAHPALLRWLQATRLAAVTPEMRTAYYWEADRPIRVEPAAVKPILHYGSGRAVLILFNASDVPVVASVSVDTARTGLTARPATCDLLRDRRVVAETAAFGLPILARDLRLLEMR